METRNPPNCKNTRITLTTLLGCLSCIGVIKECYQIGFIDEKRFFFSNLFSICLHSRHFYHKPYNQGTQGKCVRSKKQHISPDLYAFWKKIHEGSISTTLCSNCKHFLNFTCHAHKRIATEVTKIQPKPFYRGTLKKVLLPGPGHYKVPVENWSPFLYYSQTTQIPLYRSVVWSPDHTLSQGETVWWTQYLLGWFTLFVTVSPSNIQNILRKTRSRKVRYFNGDE